MTAQYEASVNQHYGSTHLIDAIIEGLKVAGKDLDHLTLEDLAPVDHMHSRGRDATLELIELAAIPQGARVLDAGGGIGGGARMLARQRGCRATVLDLTEEFCRAGEQLTAWTGLSDRVTFRHGSALDMPFDDGSFDVVWSQHATMNIEDKERLYAESYRVLRTGGRLAFHEIMAGPVAPPYYPVPWATDPAISFLRPAEDVRSLITDLGFAEVAWRDTSAPSLAWFRARLSAVRAGAAPPPLGLHVLLGPSFGTMVGNLVRNLAEQRVQVIEAVFDRP